MCNLHSLQTIFLSLFHKIPGGFADSRLCNLILEYNFKTIIGKESFASYSQLYPLAGSYFHTSNLYGTTPIYCLFRLLGLSVESSYQTWFIVICSLNFCASYLLVKSIVTEKVVCLVFSFLISSSSVYSFHIIHPQLFAFFPSILCILYLIRFQQKPSVKNILFCFLFILYQFYCDIYLGFFIFIHILIFFILYILNNNNYNNIKLLLMKYRSTFFISSLLFIGMLFLLFIPYYFYQNDHVISSSVVLDFAPRTASWINPSPFSFLYSELNNQFLQENLHPHEHVYMSSFIIHLFFIGGIIYFYLIKKLFLFDNFYFFSLTVIIVFLVFTRFSESIHNIWFYFTELFPFTTSIRVTSRIILVSNLFIYISSFFFFNKLFNYFRFKQLKYFFLSLMMLENLSFYDTSVKGTWNHEIDDEWNQSWFSYEKGQSTQRALSISQQVENNSKVKAFSFCPGSTNQPSEVIHLDAWHASLICNKSCMNGYTGYVPRSHNSFLCHPTLYNAKRLASKFSHKSGEIQFIESWSPEIKNKYSIRTYDFKLNENLAIWTDIQFIQGTKNSKIKIPVTINNNWNFKFIPKNFVTFPSYRILNLDGTIFEEKESLRTSFSSIDSKSFLKLDLSLMLPSMNGNYLVVPCFVHEGIAWGCDLGIKSQKIPLKVID